MVCFPWSLPNGVHAVSLLFRTRKIAETTRTLRILHLASAASRSDKRCNLVTCRTFAADRDLTFERCWGDAEAVADRHIIIRRMFCVNRHDEISFRKHHAANEIHDRAVRTRAEARVRRHAASQTFRCEKRLQSDRVNHRPFLTAFRADIRHDLAFRCLTSTTRARRAHRSPYLTTV